MSFLSKLKFWKRDDLGLDDDFSIDDDKGFNDRLGLDNNSTDKLVNQPDPVGDVGGSNNFNNPSSFEKQAQFQNPSQPNSEMELISSKLDTIKAELDSMNQRLRNLERIAQEESSDNNSKKRETVW